jgi:hypothetical protein
MPNRFTEAALRAQALTNKQLATEVAALSSAMNREKFHTLFPKKEEKEAFVALMAQVEKETSDEEKIVVLQQHLATAGSVVVKALKLLV